MVCNLTGAVACCFATPKTGGCISTIPPTTYFSSAELHLGEISLECSRPGAAAAALWATQKLLPLKKGGRICARIGTRKEGRAGDFRKAAPGWAVCDGLRTGVGYCRICAESRKHQRGFCFEPQDLRSCGQERSASGSCGVADSVVGRKLGSDEARTARRSFALRSVLMKPEHFDWVDRIWGVLSSSADEILGARS